MKRAILLLVVVVGGAFYLGWFTFTTSNDATGHTEHVNIAIDKDKVHEDEARALEKLHSFENQIQSESRPSTSALPPNDRSADARSNRAPRLSPANGQTSGLAPVPAPNANPYDQPEEREQGRRPLTETAAESFSRGFQ